MQRHRGHPLEDFGQAAQRGHGGLGREVDGDDLLGPHPGRCGDAAVVGDAAVHVGAVPELHRAKDERDRARGSERIAQPALGDQHRLTGQQVGDDDLQGAGEVLESAHAGHPHREVHQVPDRVIVPQPRLAPGPVHHHPQRVRAEDGPGLRAGPDPLEQVQGHREGMARHHRRVESPHTRADAGVRLQAPICQSSEDAELGGPPATASAEHEGSPDPRRRAATHPHTVTCRGHASLSHGERRRGGRRHRIAPPARHGSLGLVACVRG